MFHNFYTYSVTKNAPTIFKNDKTGSMDPPRVVLNFISISCGSLRNLLHNQYATCGFNKQHRASKTQVDPSKPAR